MGIKGARIIDTGVPEVPMHCIPLPCMDEFNSGV
jgi:hypothetical protein